MLDWLADQFNSLLKWLLALLVVAAFIAYPSLKQKLTTNASPTTLIATAPAMSLHETAKLIQAAEPTMRDAKGWANDLLNALKQNQLAQSRENVCAVIAIVDQESGFVANPTIPNLGKIAEQAVIKKLHNYPLVGEGAILFLERFPDPASSFLKKIRNAKTERDLDLAYRQLITGLEQYAKKYKLNILLDNRFAYDFIESNNDIDTIGSMQVAVSYAKQVEIERGRKFLSLADLYELRDTLYTRAGGLYYGTRLLLAYETGYDKKIYRFADFNAGRYSCRNAAFQELIANLSSKKLTNDGDLLIYKDNGEVSMTTSATEQALRELSKNLALGLSDYQIRRDLRHEKQLDFNDTKTYRTLQQSYQSRTGKKSNYAKLPKIQLSSEKTSRILTTEIFAQTVNKRYQACMAR